MTSVLYPRLLDQAARDLHYRYVDLSVAELRELHAYSHPAAVFTATGGGRVPRGHLEDLRRRVVKVAEQAGYPEEGGRRRDNSEFDREVARLLHERCGLVAAEAAVRPIWAFLALVVLPDVSYWRYPNPPVDRILATDITRHVWGRLWWRAHLLFDPTGADMYQLLDGIGEADFDQVYARRALLGGSRMLIRVLVDTWPSTDKGGLPEREVFRDLLKRLLRIAAILEFDALDRPALRELIRQEAAASVRGLWEERRRRGLSG